MASSSSGVYAGLPFSYLSANSPTEKQPPRSPRLSSRSSERERGTSDSQPEESPADPELKPFTYLTPNSPTNPEYSTDPETVSDHRESYDNQRLPRDNDGNIYPDAYKIGSDPSYYTTMKDIDHNPGDPPRDYHGPSPYDRERINAYVIPEYGNMQHSDYDRTGGYIPRPKVGYESSPNNIPDGSHNIYRHEPNEYVSNSSRNNGTARPMSRDSFLDDSYKSKKGCSCKHVVLTIVLVVLALGAGFVAGWFVSKVVNDGNNTADQSSSMMTTTSATTTTASTPTTSILSILSSTTSIQDLMPGSTTTTSTSSITPPSTDNSILSETTAVDVTTNVQDEVTSSAGSMDATTL